MIVMKEKQPVKVPSYVAKFLDDVHHHCYGMLEILNRLLEIHEEYLNEEVYNQEDYLYVKVSSWVEKVKGNDGTHDDLFLLLSDIHRNGYEPVEVKKKFVVYDVDNDYFLDKDSDFVSMIDAVQFKTKEDAIKFIIGNYEILEIYSDEN